MDLFRWSFRTNVIHKQFPPTTFSQSTSHTIDLQSVGGYEMEQIQDIQKQRSRSHDGLPILIQDGRMDKRADETGGQACGRSVLISFELRAWLELVPPPTTMFYYQVFSTHSSLNWGEYIRTIRRRQTTERQPHKRHDSIVFEFYYTLGDRVND